MPMFKPGQRVRCVNASNTIYLRDDTIYTIKKYAEYDETKVYLIELPSSECLYRECRFVSAEPTTFDEFLDMTSVECK